MAGSMLKPLAGAHAGSLATPARECYEALAPYYDLFTAEYAHESWLENLEELALTHGLSGRRLLDVGCGTGKSFAPMLARGYEVSACDISPRMVELARERMAADPGRVFVADMRALPPGGDYDLVTCLDDALNYLLDEGDLRATMRSFAAVLRRGGLAVFDLNSLMTYRTAFASDHVTACGTTTFHWRGQAREDVGAGETCRATLEVLAEDADGRATRAVSEHVQRHHPRPAVEAACAQAGLRVIAVRGLRLGGGLLREPDEDRHLKLVYLARREG